MLSKRLAKEFATAGRWAQGHITPGVAGVAGIVHLYAV